MADSWLGRGVGRICRLNAATEEGWWGIAFPLAGREGYGIGVLGFVCSLFTRESVWKVSPGRTSADLTLCRKSSTSRSLSQFPLSRLTPMARRSFKVFFI